ncbi:MAG: 30S ribosomal protein S5 [Patescibacteria group bacterium]
MQKPGSKNAGFVKKEQKEFDEEVIQIDRVTRVVKGGRKMRFRATVVIGNRKGKVGFGVGKSNEVTGAIQKAINKAKKKLNVIVLDGTTIPHRIGVKYKAAKMIMMPAVQGTGLIAGSAVRKVLELTGVKDILSKCFGANNKLNNTKAAIQALKTLRANPKMIRTAAKRAAAKPIQPAPAPVAAAKAE